MSWFYSAGGEQKGPVEAAEFESLSATGVIRPETLVWQPGMPNWQAAGEARPDLFPPPIPGVPPVPVPVYSSAASFGTTSIAGQRYAGFWIRLLARIIDSFILGIPLTPVILVCIFLVLGSDIFTGGPQALEQLSPLVVAVAVIAAFLAALCIQAAYECYMVTNYDGTIGKKALGLKIITLEGERLEFRQSLLRFGLYQGVSILSIIPLVGLLVSVYALVDAIVLGTDSRKQSLHDRFAKTLVVFK